MADDMETMPQEIKCCETWRKNYFQAVKKCSEMTEMKSRYEVHTNVLRQELDDVERQNKSLNQVLADLDVQVGIWEDEKEKESAIRVALEDNVSALKDEIQLLKNASQESDRQLQQRLSDAKKEINQLKELLVKERARADSEKTKADSALKEVEMEKSKASEAERLVNIERKSAKEVRILMQKFMMENDELKVILASERTKLVAADKVLEAEKQKTIGERKRADLATAKVEEQRKLAELNLKKAYGAKQVEEEKLKMENEALKLMLSKSEEAARKLEIEKQKTAEEKKRTDLTDANPEQQGELPVWIKKMHRRKELNLNIQNFAKLKAKKPMEIAEKQKQIATEEKHRAEELEVHKQRLEESQKQLVSYKTNADNALGYSNISDTDSVNLLKKQLKLEKMLVKHAKEATKLEAIRNNLLREELLHLKQEYSPQFQQRLDMLDDSFSSDGESI